MIDLTATADNVTRWTSLGVELPEKLAGAIETFESLRYCEIGYQPVFDLTEVTAANAEDKIREFADELALAETPAGGQSALEKAKYHALNVAAREVLRAARAAVPSIVEQLTPEFDQHAEAYAAAVAKLPENVTAQALVSAGTEAVEAYGYAQREAAYLNGVSSWVAGTAWLTGVTPHSVDVTLRILRPESLLDLIKLDGAQATPADQTLAGIDPLLFTAARLGVEFGINTLDESAQIRQSLQALQARQVHEAFVGTAR